MKKKGKTFLVQKTRKTAIKQKCKDEINENKYSFPKRFKNVCIVQLKTTDVKIIFFFKLPF